MSPVRTLEVPQFPIGLVPLDALSFSVCFISPLSLLFIKLVVAILLVAGILVA